MATVDGRWTPGIGDPTVMGWVTVVAYLGATVLCALCAMQESRRDGGTTKISRATIWWVLTGIMLFLGINKQLDLQTWMTEIGRDMAHAQGWYEQRAKVQVAFIAVLGAGALLVMLWLVLAFRKASAEARLGLAGLAFLATFV